MYSVFLQWKIKRGKKKTVTDIQRVLNIWKMINLTLEGKIAIAISKIIFQSFTKTAPKHIINELK